MTAFFLNLSQDKKNRNLFQEKRNRQLTLQLLLLSKKPTIKKKRKIPKTKHLELKKEFPAFRTKTKCVLTAASKSVFKKFSLSRHSLRKMANAGYIPMVSQSSW